MCWEYALRSKLWPKKPLYNLTNILKEANHDMTEKEFLKIIKKARQNGKTTITGLKNVVTYLKSVQTVVKNHESIKPKLKG